MFVKNFEQLSSTPLRKQALLILEAGLAAIHTPDVVKRKVRYSVRSDTLTVGSSTYPLKGVRNVVVVGFGKAAYGAATALYAVLGKRISCGFVLDLKGGSTGSLTCVIGSHPYPTLANVEATKQILGLVDALTEHDLLLCVVSGGGSSLLCYPYEISCEIETKIVETLSRAGAEIQELNTVRKHISQVKGGELARVAFPARVINLIFSDIPGDDPAQVASGPTLPDTTTVADARAVLKKYAVLDKTGLSSICLRETTKDPKYFERVSTHTLVSGGLALRAMQGKAEDLGYRCRIYREGFSGEAKDLAKDFANAPKEGECILASGESTVSVRVPGKGGRNLEMALAALPLLKPTQVFLALDSDGHDNTNFAGAIVDRETLAKAKRARVDVKAELESNSSYAFFEAVGDYIDTGLTGANVADLIISLRGY